MHSFILKMFLLLFKRRAQEINLTAINCLTEITGYFMRYKNCLKAVNALSEGEDLKVGRSPI